jgi:hypothetical protein
MTMFYSVQVLEWKEPEAQAMTDPLQDLARRVSSGRFEKEARVRVSCVTPQVGKCLNPGKDLLGRLVPGFRGFRKAAAK